MTDSQGKPFAAGQTAAKIIKAPVDAYIESFEIKEERWNEDDEHLSFTAHGGHMVILITPERSKEFLIIG